jgi:hypothetical protein
MAEVAEFAPRTGYLYAVEPGVPIPPVPVSEPNDGLPKYPFRVMGLGDSFLVPYAGEAGAGVQNRLNAAWHHFVRRVAPTWRFTTRQVDDGVRCWRIT